MYVYAHPSARPSVVIHNIVHAHFPSSDSRASARSPPLAAEVFVDDRRWLDPDLGAPIGPFRFAFWASPPPTRSEVSPFLGTRCTGVVAPSGIRVSENRTFSKNLPWCINPNCAGTGMSDHTSGQLLDMCRNACDTEHVPGNTYVAVGYEPPAKMQRSATSDASGLREEPEEAPLMTAGDFKSRNYHP